MMQTRFERFGTWLGTQLTRRPKTALVLTLAGCLLGLTGLSRARFSTDYRIFFSEADPGLASFNQLESVFTQTDNILLVVSVEHGTVFEADALAAIDELTTAAWKLPYASRVDSLTNFPYPESAGDELSVHPLLEGDVKALSGSGLAVVRARAEGEPILVGSLLSHDSRTAGVNVTLRLPRADPDEVPRTTAAAVALRDEVKARHPNLDVRATGMAFVNNAFMQTAIEDMAVMFPLMLLVMLASMALMLRSVLATAAVASVIALSAGLTMSMAGWWHYPLSPTSIAAPMIVLTVAIADGVHVVSAMMAFRRLGLDKPAAIIAALRGNLEAVTYTWLTTVVGFLCLNSSDAPPVLHLANMSSLGVTAAYLLSITLLPVLLLLLPVRTPPQGKELWQRGFHRLGQGVMRYRREIMVGSLAVTLLGGFAASQLEPNDEFIGYFDATLPFRKDIDFVTARLSGVYRLEFQLGAQGAQGVTEPAYLERVEAFAQWLRGQGEVRHTYGVNDLLARMHQVATGGERRLPQTRADASEALFLYTLNLPPGLELTDRVTLDQSASRLTVTVNDMSTRQMSGFARRAEHWLRQNAPESMWAHATGPVVIFAALSERNSRGMVKGDLWSLLLISICMVLVLRSIKLGLISVIPNLIPIVVGYGLWWCAVGQLNVVGTIAGSISLGIIVDDTIHFLTRYRAECAHPGVSSEEAMLTTLTHVGPAMVSTSLVLAFGFAVLTFSHFKMTSHLGWLSGTIVGLAPLADLIVAPGLVLMLARPKRPSASASLSLQDHGVVT